MSLFSNITGFNANTIKQYAKQDEVKEEEAVDYSNVDYCVGDDYSSMDNIFTKADNETDYKDYSNEYKLTSEYLNDDENHSKLDFAS